MIKGDDTMSHESECMLASISIIINQSPNNIVLDLLEEHINLHTEELDSALQEVEEWIYGYWEYE